MNNDRLKFRFWDTEKKKYVDGYCISSDGFFVDSVVPEQCTGLKDVNGNLIFEGDLLMDPDCFETTIVGDVRREEDGSYYCGDYGAYEFGTLEIWGTVNEHPECVE